MALTRYIVLNPVRAKMVSAPSHWPWSSHQSYLGQIAAPPWLEVAWLLGQFGSRQDEALVEYERYIYAGLGLPSPIEETRHQLVLGDDEYMRNLQLFVDTRVSRETPKAQRRAAVLSLTEYEAGGMDQAVAMAAAYRSTAYTMRQIADHFGVSARTVSRAIRRCETEDHNA